MSSEVRESKLARMLAQEVRAHLDKLPPAERARAHAEFREAFAPALIVSAPLVRGRALLSHRAPPPEFAMSSALRLFILMHAGAEFSLGSGRCPLCDEPQSHLNDLVLHGMRVHSQMWDMVTA